MTYSLLLRRACRYSLNIQAHATRPHLLFLPKSGLACVQMILHWLRQIDAGHYVVLCGISRDENDVNDSMPGDRRECTVSHADAVNVRAEDGRYVRDVNVSAFLSDLPSGSTSGRSVNGALVPLENEERSMRFCMGDASGSTSQEANVIDAIESGASALLVDEDVSAANFMAHDRMHVMKRQFRWRTGRD
jgi:hypothetical protein